MTTTLSRRFAIALPLLVGLLALGGATEVTLGLILVATVPVALTRRRRLSGRARVIRAVLIVMTLWQAFQLVPLPLGWLARLSPGAASFWRNCGAVVQRAPIALDPPGARFALATSLVALAAFAAFASRASTKDARRDALTAIAIAIIAFDVLSIAHPLFGLDRLYGLYEPRYHTTPGFLRAPLINANHASAVAGAGVPILCALGFAAEEGPKRWGLMGLAAFSGLVALLTFSRGGAAVLAGQLALLTLILLKRGARGAAAALAACAVAVGAAATLVAKEELVAQLGDQDTSKLRLMSQSFALVKDYRWFGVGPNAFPSVFGGYVKAADASSVYGEPFLFTHVESWPLQIAVDLGMPLAILLVVVAGGALIASVRHSIAGPSVGALIALVGLFTHDLFDFSLCLAGPAVLAAACAAVVAQSGRDSSGVGRFPSAVGVVALAGAAWALIGAWGRQLDDEIFAVSQAARSGDAAAVESIARTAWPRHPAQAAFPLAIGAALGPKAEAGPYLARAVALSPSVPNTHVALGRWFHARGATGQAWVELKIAARLSRPGAAEKVARYMVALGAPVWELMALDVRASSIEAASLELVAKGRKDDARLLDGFLVETFPPAVSARVRLIRGLNDAVAARAAADQLIATAPKDPRSYALRAELGVDGADAVRVLEQGLAMAGDDEVILRPLALRLVADWPRTEAILERLRLRLVGEPYGLMRFYAFHAECALLAGKPIVALASYRQAATLSADGLAYLPHVARLTEAQGDVLGAERVWERLSLARPDNAEWSAEWARVRAKRPQQQPIVSP